MHLPGTSEEVELVDVEPAHVNLERGKDILNRHLEGFDFGAVDVHKELRRTGPKEVNTPAKAGSAFALATKWSALSCNLGRSTKPCCSIWNWKPPALPTPRIGGERKHADDGALDFRSAQSSWSRGGDGRVVGLLVGAFVKRLQNDEHRTEVGAVVFSRNDSPEMPTVCATPGMSRAILSILAMIASVRCTDAESGNCAFTSR